MTIEASLSTGWSTLEDLCRGEYGLSLQNILAQHEDDLNFKRVGRLMAVWVKHPFAQLFPYDPDLPTNWAKAQRCWEIRERVDVQAIENHKAQFEFLLAVANEWGRPAEFIAEFNIFHSVCRRLKPAICGEAKARKGNWKMSKQKSSDIERSRFAPKKKS